jgi:hypothetical protein
MTNFKKNDCGYRQEALLLSGEEAFSFSTTGCRSRLLGSDGGGGASHAGDAVI